eukprot:TRINITY_DN19813_c0_g3_i1.p1 TRINITY_DN19813_c0_g3~~TRINITY_DN19813_c0_g3_i1.p1  ORF type:complete len:732 (-),score=71.70 TRINITY_DN19813_c0_g3_i1:154-2283(-)
MATTAAAASAVAAASPRVLAAAGRPNSVRPARSPRDAAEAPCDLAWERSRTGWPHAAGEASPLADGARGGNVPRWFTSRGGFHLHRRPSSPRARSLDARCDEKFVYHRGLSAFGMTPGIDETFKRGTGAVEARVPCAESPVGSLLTSAHRLEAGQSFSRQGVPCPVDAICRRGKSAMPRSQSVRTLSIPEEQSICSSRDAISRFAYNVECANANVCDIESINHRGAGASSLRQRAHDDKREPVPSNMVATTVRRNWSHAKLLAQTKRRERWYPDPEMVKQAAKREVDEEWAKRRRSLGSGLSPALTKRLLAIRHLQEKNSEELEAASSNDIATTVSSDDDIDEVLSSKASEASHTKCPGDDILQGSESECVSSPRISQASTKSSAQIGADARQPHVDSKYLSNISNHDRDDIDERKACENSSSRSCSSWCSSREDHGAGSMFVSPAHWNDNDVTLFRRWTDPESSAAHDSVRMMIRVPNTDGVEQGSIAGLVQEAFDPLLMLQTAHQCPRSSPSTERRTHLRARSMRIVARQEVQTSTHFEAHTTVLKDVEQYSNAALSRMQSCPSLESKLACDMDATCTGQLSSHTQPALQSPENLAPCTQHANIGVIDKETLRVTSAAPHSTQGIQRMTSAPAWRPDLNMRPYTLVRVQSDASSMFVPSTTASGIVPLPAALQASTIGGRVLSRDPYVSSSPPILVHRANGWVLNGA